LTRDRFIALAVLTLMFGFAGAEPVRADHAPVYVVPGKAGVPVYINGQEASYTVVEGDWGLSRPGHVVPTIVYGPLIGPPPLTGYGYFPRTGRPPRSGRYEIEPQPNRALPPPAESYYRHWSAGADPKSKVTTYPPFDPPPVILAPEFGREPQRRPRRKN